MKSYLDIEKIEVKKTKVNMVVSQPIDKDSTEREATTDLLLKMCLMGCSPNAINQLIDEGCLSQFDFNEIAYARTKVLDIARNLKITIGNKLDNVRPQTHKFY
jgi:hypothetical protein